ncbi:MAG TPA: PQQ-binding-like beta-propeller repeat protein [Planctomycetaceae bacterium]|nr:PQQ-binding-like beta-propeller repeat protein [Planctomycetaceae bacterium]
MRRFVCALALAGWLSQGAFAGENWPEFRGPHADGHSSAKNLPAEFSDTENVKWKTPIHGRAWSSPVIWGKQIWLTTAPEDGKERSALCIDLDSGKILRDILVYEVAKPEFINPMNSYATPTPAIEEGRVYVHFGSVGTAAIDTNTGKILWSRQDLPCDHFRGAASSPVIYKDRLILTFDGFDHQYVAALDKNTGETLWKKDRDIEYGTPDGDAKKGYSTPAIIEVDGQPQVISPAAVATIAYSPLNGDEIWKLRHGGMNASARPLYGHGVVLITAGTAGKVFAVHPNGRGDVTDTKVEWKSTQAVPTRSSQLLIGDLLFMVSDAGIASCVDATTGEQIWQHRLQGKYSASPIYADGKIYFVSEEGFVPVIEPAKEFKLLAENKLGDGFMASPAATDHELILRSRTHLYRIEKTK